MAKNEEILRALAAESGPASLKRLADVMGLPSSAEIGAQLKRMESQGLVERNEAKEYLLTDQGRAKALEAESEEETEETLGVTEYQQFIKLGKTTGVTPYQLIKQTADHVWRGGDYRDLEWVAKAFQEMDIRSDLAKRWWHSWRSYLHQPVPASATPLFSSSSKEEPKEAKEETPPKGVRSHILDADDKPVYVGEGLGDLDYKDAIRIAEVRAAAKARLNQPTQSVGSMGDEMVKVIRAIQETMPQSQSRSYIVKPSQDGYQVEEVEEGKPLIVPSPANNNTASPSYLVNSDGEIQEIKPGQPIVIKQTPPPASQAATHYLIDKSTGEVKEVSGNQPVVIIREQAPQQSQAPMIQAVDPNGNPLVIDLATYFKLEEHKAKQRREEESHEVKMEISKGFKDLITKAATAFDKVK